MARTRSYAAPKPISRKIFGDFLKQMALSVRIQPMQNRSISEGNAQQRAFWRNGLLLSLAVGIACLTFARQIFAQSGNCNNASDVNGNTAYGDHALVNVTTGQYNTAVGAYALVDLMSNSSNTAMGYQALYLNTADNNTAVGANALFGNRTG